MSTGDTSYEETTITTMVGKINNKLTTNCSSIDQKFIDFLTSVCGLNIEYLFDFHKHVTTIIQHISSRRATNTGRRIARMM